MFKRSITSRVSLSKDQRSLLGTVYENTEVATKLQRAEIGESRHIVQQNARSSSLNGIPNLLQQMINDIKWSSNTSSDDN